MNDGNEWFAASRLIGMPGLPGTVQSVLARANKEGWRCRPRAGKGGGKEYHYSSLPNETQRALGFEPAQPQVTDQGVYVSKEEFRIHKVHVQLLENVIIAVRSAMIRDGLQPSPPAEARLIAGLYSLLAEGNAVDSEEASRAAGALMDSVLNDLKTTS